MSGRRCGGLASALAEINDWQDSVKVRELRDACCQAHGIAPRSDRPCFWLDNVLSDAECDALLSATLEHHDPEPSSSGVETEPGCRSQFCSQDAPLSALLWERIRGAVPQDLDGGRAVGLMETIAHARYFTGQVGFPHMDFRHGPDDDRNVASRISFTVYLNDTYEGGELGFIGKLRMDGSYDGEHLREKSRKGSAALFYQGVPEFAHLPHAITSGCKSIMRADVLYRFEDEEAADVGCLKTN